MMEKPEWTFVSNQYIIQKDMHFIKKYFWKELQFYYWHILYFMLSK